MSRTQKHGQTNFDFIFVGADQAKMEMRRRAHIGPSPRQVRLVGDNAEQLGIMPLFNAHELAKKLGPRNYRNCAPR